MRCRKKGHHIVTKCGKVAKYNADQHLQELYRLKVFAQQQDLDQIHIPDLTMEDITMLKSAVTCLRTEMSKLENQEKKETQESKD